MADFTRGLAQCGARVIGLGEHPVGSLPSVVKQSLSDYLCVPSLVDSDSVLAAVRGSAAHTPIDRVECLWEPFMTLAAQLREMLDIGGMHTAQTELFRDKKKMKDALDAAGLRTPRNTTATGPDAIRTAAGKIGLPLVIKPIAGAGSAHTHEVRDQSTLEAAIADVGAHREVSVEEFVDGEEYTFDTITVRGRIAYYNIAWYRPRPLVARSNEWISPQVIALRELDRPELQNGVKMGYEVIEALGFDTGFTHMEWYRKADGEVVFGEIGARPPGAHQVDQMKYVCDFDVFREWANAVTQGRISDGITPQYNVANIYKRARGIGRITAIEGADKLQREFGEHVVWNTLLPVGAQRRDWRKTLVSDGFVMLRHPDLATTLAMADRVGSDLQLYAG